MRIFHWTRAKSVFMPELDDEHRKLYELAAGIQEQVTAGTPPEIVSATLKSLVAAAEDHFQHEERMMRRAQYRLFAWHKSQHETFRKRSGSCLARYEAGQPEAAAELLDFLPGWMNDHLHVADRMMSAALRAYARLHAA